MKTIKVRITLYNDYSPAPHELAYALFDEYRTIDVTDEQHAYLLETEFGQDCGVSKDFKLLRQDIGHSVQRVGREALLVGQKADAEERAVQDAVAVNNH